jgi:Meiotically Up-regulated Gene 113 (MUG113) protein
MPTPSRSGYIYLLGSERFGWFKIGRSIEPVIRIENIGVLLPFRVEVFSVWAASDCVAAEVQMHRRYADNAINGEWFSFKRKEMILAKNANYPWFSEQVYSQGTVAHSSFSTFSNLAEDKIKYGPNPESLKAKKTIKQIIYVEANRRLAAAGIDWTPEVFRKVVAGVRKEYLAQHGGYDKIRVITGLGSESRPRE